MPGGMKLTSLAVVLSLFLVGAVRAECPAGDLSGDCEIDFEDLQFFAEQWLDPNCEGADCADLDMVDGVNMADFALMGAHWAQIGTPLVINELMASNARFMPDPQGEYDDWIELYNGAEQPVDVGGMYLTDDLDQPRMWRFPTDSPYSTTIDSHRFLWVWTDGDSGDYGLHTNFELDADGEEIALFDKDGSTLIDRVEFGGQTADISYGRYPDGSSQWRFLGLASPRTPNSEAYLGEVADCKFSHKGGFYNYNPRFDRPPLVTIACETEGATIYYTVDGSEPYELSGRFPNGAIYSGPLTIAVRTCLRAKAIKPGWKPSATKTNTYFINETGPIRSLPAISLVAGATTTFYAPDGIMAYPTMRGMAYERPVSFEYTYPQDNSGFQIDCGLRVHGSDWMRPRYSYCPGPGVWEGNCKFSFRPYFRGMYGKSRLEYPIFPFEVDSFKSLVFRGGHNDRVNPFIKDELIRRLFADMGNVSSRGVMANLFINGEYRGYYNPCEHIKEEFCQEWYGSDKGWDVMTMNGIRDGDSVSWNNMLSRVRNYDLSQPSNYAEAARHLDVASFADYLIIELWAGNWDWPQNNWAAASERSEEGKWRFFIWDAEGSMSSGELYTVFFDRLNSQNNANGWLYRSLKSSQTFRHVFADRIYKHFYNDGAMTEANIQRRFYELKNMLYGVIPSMNMYVLNTWVPSRLSTFLNACIQEGVFTFNGPTLKINGSSQYGGPASVGDSLGMSDPQGSGTIYYTVDGSDPRESGALPPVTTTVLAPYSAAKRVLVPTGPVHDNWRGGAAFDDLLWTPCSGSPGGVGYERSSGYGELLSLNVHDQMFAKNCSCLIRIPFYLEDDPAKFESMSLNVWYDDGFVAYLNGNLIKQVLFAGDPSWNSEANGSHEATSIASFDVSGYLGSLRQGNNILAIHGLNYGASSSDFVISAELIARAPGSGGGTTPGRTQYTHPVTLQKTTHIKASIQRGGKWSALGEATFAVGPVAENFRITEMMYHPFNADDPNDPNDPNEEFIELANLGTQELNLYLVRFTKGIDFTFPSLDVAAGERIVVVQDSSTFRARYGGAVRIAGQYEGRLDNGGERIRLEDAIGRTILDFKYKDGWRRVADGHGYSLTMIKPTAPDANSWGEKDNWRASAYEGGSPGEDDGGIIPNPGSVVINEILAHSHAEAPDWIELYNTTDADIDIGGWYLSDSEADLKKYEIAAGTKIKGRNFKLFYEDVNFGEPSSDAGRHTPFAFSENGDELYLTAAKAGVLLGYREYEDFGASETGVSFGRYYKSSTDNTNFVPMDHNTPGQPNAYPQVGPVVISEIMYNPDWPYGGSYVNDQYEYVELHNAGGSEVALYDFDEDEPWKLVDGIDFTFIDVSPVTIPAGGYLVVAKNPEAFAWRYPNVPGELVLGPYDGKLSDGGEKVELAKPGDVDEFGERQYIRVDRVAYSDGAHPGDTPGEVDLWPIAADGAGSSLTRTNMTLYGNDPNNWTAQTPSPAQ